MLLYKNKVYIVYIVDDLGCTRSISGSSWISGWIWTFWI